MQGSSPNRNVFLSNVGYNSKSLILLEVVIGGFQLNFSEFLSGYYRIPALPEVHLDGP